MSAFSLNTVFIMFSNLCDYYLCNLMSTSAIRILSAHYISRLSLFFLIEDKIGTWKIAADCLRQTESSQQLDGVEQIPVMRDVRGMISGLCSAVTTQVEMALAPFPV